MFNRADRRQEFRGAAPGFIGDFGCDVRIVTVASRQRDT
jgi:hypothetical protein